MSYKISRIVAISLLLLVACTASAAAGKRIFLPEDLFYHRFASFSPDAEAVWTNPAWLPASRNIYLQYFGEYEEGKLSDDKALLIAGDRIGFAWRGIKNLAGAEYSEYTFAAGMPLFRDFYIGGSYRYISKGPGLYHKRHFWNAAVLINKYDHVKIAAVWSNLNRGKVDGERSEIEQLYSVSYFTPGSNLILSTEITLAGSQRLSDAEFRFGAQLPVSDRIRLFGMIDEDKFLQLGLVFSIDRYISGFQSRFDDETDHTGTTVFGGIKYTPPRR